MTVFQENPKSGAISTISAFLIGMVPNVDPQMQNLVIFWFQVVAFSISIIVGILTIIGYVKKLKNNQRHG